MTNSDEIAQILEKMDLLIKRSDGTEPHIFDEEEVNKIKRLMLALDRIETLGFFARYAFYALLGAGAIIANWERIMGWWRG